MKSSEISRFSVAELECLATFLDEWFVQWEDHVAQWGQGRTFAQEVFEKLSENLNQREE